MPTAPANPKELCALIVRSKLMGAEELKGVLRHLKPTGSDAEDLEIVRRTLIGGKHLTDYQAALLMRGHAEGFFLGPYRIQELISKGRMTGVYRAMHLSGQTVAIKVLPASKAKDPEVLARFKREARLLTRLDHPNVVRAFHLGDADGKSYLVMEYLEGDTLEELLAKWKRLPPMEAVRIVHQAMLGLEHIHQKGMIHRDLMPSNLMLVNTAGQTSEGFDRPLRILDIGLGKSVFNEDETSPVDDPSQLTNDGVLIGTPDYLAPEQARSAKSADIRADIYSLGCVLYHALTGQPPFPDKSVLNQVMRHATEPPRALAEFLSEVPDGLQNVMNWMLAKDPAQRYATPEKAAQALNLFLRNSPPSRTAPQATPAYMKWLEESTEIDTSKPAPTNIPVGRLEPSTRKPGTAPAPALAVPVPTRPARPAPIVAPLDMDVELVSVPAMPVKPAEEEEKRGLFELDRRDAIMLCAGGAMVLTAIIAGYGVSRALRKETPPPAEPNETGTPKEG
ncbi:MAG TPA: protein kinase [Gemmataceae bacterium]|jgi:serine/threonine protein kinase|nr:protein kinase [Gemmataceae bacterium]